MKIITQNKAGWKLLFLVFILACNTNEQPVSNETNVNVVTEVDNPIQSGTKLGYVLPSPFEIAGLIKKTGTHYSYEYLNSLDNVNKYITNYKKAINLGVYGADLGYAFMFGQTQDAIKYLNNNKKLADQLGIMGGFEQSMVKSIEQNINNQDSVLRIVAESFSKMDAYLKESERNVTSALIITGGWVEALYIASQACSKTKNKEIINRIGEQKISLEILLALLNQYKDDGENVSGLIKEMEELKIIFEEVKINYEYNATEVDPVNKISEINTRSIIYITDNVLKKISDKVFAIRNNIIS